MKKLISIVLCAVTGLSMAACGGSSASASAKEYNLDDIVSAVEAVNPVSNPREVDDFALENYQYLPFHLSVFLSRLPPP